MSKVKPKTPDLSQKIMTKIKHDHVTMRPKAYFVLGSTLLVLGFIGLIIISLFYWSVSNYHLRSMDPFGYLMFGSYGQKAFITIFPWKSLLLTIIGLVGGLSLLRRYDISYKRNFLVLASALTIAILITGVILDSSGINQKMSQHHVLAPNFRQEFIKDSFVMGEVVATDTTSLMIKPPNKKEIITINWDQYTILPSGSNFQVGDRVRAVGSLQENNTFNATGISQGGLRWSTPKPSLQPHRLRPSN